MAGITKSERIRNYLATKAARVMDISIDLNIPLGECQRLLGMEYFIGTVMPLVSDRDALPIWISTENKRWPVAGKDELKALPFGGNYGLRRMLNEMQWKARYRGLLQHYKLTKQKLDAEREKRIHAFTRFDYEALN